jgi:glycosyltransferase involved in cell wall biosynthesis
MEGIGWFTYESLKRITTGHPEHQFFFLFDRPYSNEYIFSDNIQPVVIPPQARHPVLFYLWFEYSVPYALRKIRPDLFLSTDGYLSLATPVKSLVVIHDLNFEHYPKDLPFLVRKHYRYFFPRYARKAVRIATVSEFSKKDIISLYGTSPEKIDVVYNGAGEQYIPVDDEIQRATREKYCNGAPFFIFIGALHPRKNLANLFRAFDLFREKVPTNIKLVIVGAKKWWTADIQDTYNAMKYRDEVVFTGRLTSVELSHILGSALALTYVSYFEGFGIPIVEAFYCDTPVITSGVTSMPEVAGDAALIVDPFSVESIADAMIAMARDEALRKNLIERARIRRLSFSWQKTADKLWESIEKTYITPVQGVK